MDQFFLKYEGGGSDWRLSRKKLPSIIKNLSINLKIDFES